MELKQLNQSLATLLAEVFFGPGQGESWLLNPGDDGLVPGLKKLTAEQASFHGGKSRKSIASHANHVLYHLELICRWVEGEENPFATADWSEAWNLVDVNEEEWQQLTDQLESRARFWIDASENVPLGNELAFKGSFASISHTAYHLGAIRQLILAKEASAK